MALIRCPECKKRVSDTAEFCPHCGYAVRENVTKSVQCNPDTTSLPNQVDEHDPAPGKRTKKILFPVLGIIVLLAVVLRILAFYPGWAGQSSETEPTEPTEKTLSSEEIYMLASAATVEIQVETYDGQRTGTGFFDDQGRIITNYHVVEHAQSGCVILSDGEEFDIEYILGYNEKFDVAIIKIDCNPYGYLSRREEPLVTGEKVYAVGSSLGLTGSFSEGIVSAASREINDVPYIQTTAPISQGNSGGPLLDEYGRVVGITSAGVDGGQNLNLAIPIDFVDRASTHAPKTFPEFNRATAEHYITVAISPNRPPFEYVENGVYKGVNIDIANELAARYNWAIDFVEVDFEDIMAGVSSEEYDMAFGFESTVDCEEDVSSIEYFDGMSAIFHASSFGELLIIKNPMTELIEDGIIDEIMESYGIS